MRVDRPRKSESSMHTDYRSNLSVTDVARERLETWRAWSSTRLPSLACCKVAVGACFLSSQIYCAGSGSGLLTPAIRGKLCARCGEIYCAGSGSGLLTRPSSATTGLPAPNRWRVTWRPRSAEGRLFVDHYLGGSLGSAVEAACRAGYAWTEQMSRKMLRNVEKRGVHTASLPLEPGWTGSKLSLAITTRPAFGGTRPSRLISHVLASHCRRPEIEAMRGR
jgi:hypothetical protein